MRRGFNIIEYKVILRKSNCPNNSKPNDAPNFLCHKVILYYHTNHATYKKVTYVTK
ncbi:hypothetical protein Lalb_Chr09g0330681 [Lupinus albus]|uniref:Uncharacterized protein n=1 Tax=Lupinus albus TaxID=3870 RepID=A0A6A4Q100_LUPAL|nr:hypothetical protein Lalb_Chr09g0330681 [Lupinus albus]